MQLFHFAFLLSGNMSFSCFTSLPPFGVLFLDFDHSKKYIVLYHVLFNLHLSDDIRLWEHLIMCHLCTFFPILGGVGVVMDVYKRTVSQIPSQVQIN
jgi:hypothetical protein